MSVSISALYSSLLFVLCEFFIKLFSRPMKGDYIKVQNIARPKRPLFFFICEK